MLSIEGDLRRIDHRCVSSKWDSYNRSAPSEMILSLNIFINEAQASDVQELVHKLKVLSHICASLSLSLQLASERKHWHAAPKRPTLLIIPERCEIHHPHRLLLGCQWSRQLLQVDLWHHWVLTIIHLPPAPTPCHPSFFKREQWQYKNRDERGSYE